MAKIRVETVNGQEITIVEDTKEDLRNFLDEGQKMDQLKGQEKEAAIQKLTGGGGGDLSKKEGEAVGPPTRSEKEFSDAIENRQGNSQRANSDVVLAMMISNQASAEAVAEGACYVVHGARMICSMGSREARLVVPMDHGTCLKNKPQMVDQDYKAIENIKCFGNCFSVKNPHMQQAAVDMTNQYNQKKSESGWGKVKGWFGVKPKKVEAVSDELAAACICECIPVFVNSWTDSGKKPLVDGKKALTQTDTLICEYGGIVRIIDNGQDS